MSSYSSITTDVFLRVDDDDEDRLELLPPPLDKDPGPAGFVFDRRDDDDGILLRLLLLLPPVGDFRASHRIIFIVPQ